MPTPLEQFKENFHPFNNEIERISQHHKLIVISSRSKNNEVEVMVAGNYELISISFQDSLFLCDNVEIEEMIISAINSAFFDLWLDTKCDLYISNISELAKQMPKNITSIIRDIQDEYAGVMEVLLRKDEIFYSSDGKVKFNMSGGYRLLSIHISEDYLHPSNKEAIENNVKDGINSYITANRRRMKLLFQEIVGKYFNQVAP